MISEALMNALGALFTNGTLLAALVFVGIVQIYGIKLLRGAVYGIKSYQKEQKIKKTREAIHKYKLQYDEKYQDRYFADKFPKSSGFSADDKFTSHRSDNDKFSDDEIPY